MEIISASIDLTKIDKSKIVEGKKGQKYYNIGIIVNDEKNQFGQNVSLFDDQSKEEREARKPKNYLGNGKSVWSNNKNIDVPDEEIATSNKKDSSGLPF